MSARRHPLPLPKVLLALLLLAGQFTAIAHAFEHDPGATPSQACASCITVAQLGAASIAPPAEVSLPPASFDFVITTASGFASTALPAVRQRGPPHSLPKI